MSYPGFTLIRISGNPERCCSHAQPQRTRILASDCAKLACTGWYATPFRVDFDLMALKSQESSFLATLIPYPKLFIDERSGPPKRSAARL